MKKYVVLLVVLALFMLPAVALAQGVDDSLPTNLDDLLGPAGLGVVVVIVMGLLKKAGKLGEWITKNSLNGFAMSLAVAGVILGAVHLVKYLGVYDYAQNFWLNFGVAWAVAQVWYNIQKAGSSGYRAMLNI